MEIKRIKIPIKISLLLLVNFLIVQWFFFRICRFIKKESGKQEGWGIVFPAVPLTGWWSNWIPNSLKVYWVCNYGWLFKEK